MGMVANWIHSIIRGELGLEISDWHNIGGNVLRPVVLYNDGVIVVVVVVRLVGHSLVC
jgi:hypothetical protein